MSRTDYGRHAWTKTEDEYLAKQKNAGRTSREIAEDMGLRQNQVDQRWKTIRHQYESNSKQFKNSKYNIWTEKTKQEWEQVVSRLRLFNPKTERKEKMVKERIDETMRQAKVNYYSVNKLGRPMIMMTIEDICKLMEYIETMSVDEALKTLERYTDNCESGNIGSRICTDQEPGEIILPDIGTEQIATEEKTKVRRGRVTIEKGEIDENEIIEKIRKGLSALELAVEYGYTEWQMSDFIKKHNLREKAEGKVKGPEGIKPVNCDTIKPPCRYRNRYGDNIWGCDYYCETGKRIDGQREACLCYDPKKREKKLNF